MSQKVLCVRGTKYVMSQALAATIPNQLDIGCKVRQCPTRQRLMHKAGKLELDTWSDKQLMELK